MSATRKDKVIMRIYAGGGWSGMIVYEATHPENKEIQLKSNNYEEVKEFCSRHDLEEDVDFNALCSKHLMISMEFKTPIRIIPLTEIDENRFWSSGSEYLRRHFGEYYGSIL